MEHPLSRTLLLMRDELKSGVTGVELLAALASVRLLIRIETSLARSSAGQSALLTLAWLLARSGHEVWIDAEDEPLVGPQPPATQSTVHSALMEVGNDLSIGSIFCGRPETACLEFRMGSVAAAPLGLQVVHLGWTRWMATLGQSHRPIPIEDPAGALGAAALGAAEAFKIAMLRLQAHALAPDRFAELFAPTASCQVRLAPEKMPAHAALLDVDVVSAGAIANGALYLLYRLPSSGRMRVADDDVNGLTNLNRNALQRRSNCGQYKARNLAAQAPEKLLVEPVVGRYGSDAGVLQNLASAVLLGVDDVPARWAAQKAAPGWVGVGATSHFMTLVSSHAAGEPCAGCLHPHDEAVDGPIPTVAFVSFWSGLLLATRLIQHRTGFDPVAAEQQTVFYPLRPEGTWTSPVAAHPNCPVACDAAGRAIKRAA